MEVKARLRVDEDSGVEVWTKHKPGSGDPRSALSRTCEFLNLPPPLLSSDEAFEFHAVCLGTVYSILHALLCSVLAISQNFT